MKTQGKSERLEAVKKAIEEGKVGFPPSKPKPRPFRPFEPTPLDWYRLGRGK